MKIEEIFPNFISPDSYIPEFSRKYLGEQSVITVTYVAKIVAMICSE